MIKRQDIERRKFIRLDSVFPVEFQILDAQGKPSSWLQGFTNNVSRGGISLVANNIPADLEDFLNNSQGIKFSLKIDIPLFAKSKEAFAQLVWVKKIKEDIPNQYNFGLRYEKINPRDNKKILRYAQFRCWFPRITIGILAILLAISLFMGYVNSKLMQGNIGLVEELVSILQNSIVAKQQIKVIRRQKIDSDTRLSEITIKIKNLNEALTGTRNKEAQDIRKKIDDLEKEKSSLEKTLFELARKENYVAEQVLVIDEKIPTLTKNNLDKIYEWLENHQNQKTGLVASYEPGQDTSLWANLYEQALSIFAYNYFGDYKYSQKLLEFFYQKAKRHQGLFFDVYNANSTDVIKKEVNIKANVWLGMAILDYVFRTRDNRYLILAKEIAENLNYFRNKNEVALVEEYIFSKMLYSLTQDKTYLPDDKILERLRRRKLIDSEELVILLLGVDPDKLAEFGLNVEDMISSLEDNYSIVSHHQRSKSDILAIQGFSFKKDGLIDVQTTARIILIYKTIAKYYTKIGNSYKARLYQDKADDYLAEIGKLIFSSPCNIDKGQGCLPATNTILSRPSTKPHISIGATIYTLFAYYGYDPATLNEK